MILSSLPKSRDVIDESSSLRGLLTTTVFSYRINARLYLLNNVMKKKLFLSDEPILELTGDAFGHEAFVNTLYRCVTDCDCKVNVGLFGRWGVGKTSIVHLLLKKLEGSDKKFATLFFDAWKYSESSLPQELVMGLNGKYGIEEESKLEAEIYNIQEEEAPPIEYGWKNTLKRFWKHFKVSIISTLLLLVLFMSLYYSGRITIGIYTSLIFVVFLPIIVNLIIRMDSIVTPGKKLRILPAKSDPGRLENKFREIVNGIIKKNKADRLIVIIDNLDRCSGDVAIAMLGAIKSLMEHDKCVYVFPCDYSTLIKHLVSVRKYDENDAREFLRKFFQTSLTIPTLLAQDIERFTEGVLSELEIEYDKEIIQVLINAFSDNPRQIKQFLNNLTIQYIAAQEREKVGIFKQGELTNKAVFLAKILVIRQEYPLFYSELEIREDLLDVAESFLRGRGDSLKYYKYDEEQKKMVERDLLPDNPGLEQFLHGTITITAEDISPFLKLNKETYPSTIPDAQEFRLQIYKANADYFLDELGKLDEKGKEEYAKQIVRFLEGKRKSKDWGVVFNGVDIMAKIYGAIPVAAKIVFANKVGSLITLALMRDYLEKLDYSAMFTMLRDMEKKYRDDILEQYASSLSTAEITQPLFDHIIGISDLLPEKAIKTLDLKLINAYGENRGNAEIVIKKIVEKPVARGRLISENLVAKIEQTVDTTAVDEKVIGLYLTLKNLSSNQTKLSFLEKLLAAVSTNKDATYDNTKQFGVLNLLRLEEMDIPHEGVDELYRVINEYTGLMSAPNDKLQFIKVFFRFIDIFAEPKQEEFMRNRVVPIVDSGNANILNQILEIAREQDVAILDYDFVLDSYINRVQTNLPDSGLIGSIIRTTKSENKEKAKDMLIALVNRPEAQYHNLGLENFTQFYSGFEDEQIGEICDACLQRATSAQKAEKQKFITPILNAFEKCPVQFQRTFADFTLNFIRDEDQDIRNLGISCFETIEPFIGNEKKQGVIIQTLNIVAQKASQNTIDGNIRPILDLVIKRLPILDRNDVIRLIDTLMGLDNVPNDPEVRIIGIEYLGETRKLYHRRSLVIRKLEEDLEDENEQIQEQAKQSLQMLEATGKEASEQSPPTDDSIK